MRIKKILNNNLVLAQDENMTERMVMGRGIGFRKKQGDVIRPEEIDKVFVLESQALVDQFVTLVRSIPINHLELTKKVVEAAQEELGLIFDDFIYIGLADHISYALYRHQQNIVLTNALTWEIRKFYAREYKAALKALDVIEYYEGIRLCEAEASFIAMHFVNAQTSGEAVQLSMAAAGIIQDILNIVKFHYMLDLNEETMQYSRFVTHIRYFLQRVHQPSATQRDTFLFEQVKLRYPDAYDCACKIKTYLEEKLQISINEDEMLYFMLHIKCLVDRERDEKQTREETGKTEESRSDSHRK